jgi:hypothetical protein
VAVAVKSYDAVVVAVENGLFLSHFSFFRLESPAISLQSSAEKAANLAAISAMAKVSFAAKIATDNYQGCGLRRMRLMAIYKLRW